MRKIALVSLAVLTLSLTACGKSKDEETTVVTTETAAETTTETTTETTADITESTTEAQGDVTMEYNVTHEYGANICLDWTEKTFHSEDGMVLNYYADGERITISVYNDPEGHPDAHVTYNVYLTEEDNVLAGKLDGIDEYVTYFGIGKNADGEVVIDVRDAGSDYHEYFKE